MKLIKLLGGMYDGLVMEMEDNCDYMINTADPHFDDHDQYVSYVRSSKKDEDGNELFEYQGGRK